MVRHLMEIEPLELRIAPANLVFAGGIGAAGTQSVSDAVFDPAGNLYVAGTFVGAADFDPGPGTSIRTASAGHTFAFVAKYTGIGELVWVATVDSSTGLAEAPELAVSELGEVYFMAQYGLSANDSLNFVGTNNDTLPLSPAGPQAAIYLAKIGATGVVNSVNSIGGSGGIADLTDVVISGGDLYFAGTVSNGASPGLVQIGAGIPGQVRSDPNETDFFLAKYSTQFGTIDWVRETTSTGVADVGQVRLAAGGPGNVYLAGTFSGAITLAGFSGTLTAADTEDYFFASFNASGTPLAFGSISGGGPAVQTNRAPVGVIADTQGNFSVAGHFSGIADFDPGIGVDNVSSAGGYDLFFLSLTSTGGYLGVNAYGGENDEKFLALERNGNRLTLVGTFDTATDIDIADATVSLKSKGAEDAVLISMNPAGTALEVLQLAVENGPSGSGLFLDEGKGGGFVLAAHPSGTLAMLGTFRGTFDTDPGSGVKNVVSKGGIDISIAGFLPEGRLEQSLPPPALAQSFTFGGTGIQLNQAVEVDQDGNLFLAGYFQGTVDFDPGSAVRNLTATNSGGDIYVAKFDDAGVFQWVRAVSTILPTSDPALYLDVDSLGNVFIAGEYEVSAALGPFNLINADSSPGNRDVFAASLDPDGTFQWANSFGGAGTDEFVDAFSVHQYSGDVALVGTFASATDFNPGVGTDIRVPVGPVGLADAYVVSFTNNGVYRWMRHLAAAGGGEAKPSTVTFDNFANVVVAGDFTGTVNLDTGGSPGLFLTAPGASRDIFVAKFAGVNGVVGPATIFGGDFNEKASALLATDDDIYLAGEFTGYLNLDALPPLIATDGRDGLDVFILKLDDSLGVQSAISFGGTGQDHVAGLALDGTNSLVVAGDFGGTVDFDPSGGVARLTGASNDLFVARYDLLTMDFKSAFRMAAFDPTQLSGNGFTADDSGNVYFAGGFLGSIDADLGPAQKIFKSKGALDAIFLKFSPTTLGNAAFSRSFHDVDGDVVTLRISGPGSFQYSLVNEVGDFANAAFIELIGTTLATTFSVTVTQAGNGDGTTVIQKITTDQDATGQHIGAIILPSTVTLGDSVDDLVPDLFIGGASKNLRLGNLNGNTYIKLGSELPYNVVTDNTTPDTYNHRPNLTINEVFNFGVVIEVTGNGLAGGVGGGGLGTVIIGDWEHTGFIRTTQSIGSLTILRGDFFATLQVDPDHVGEGTTANVGSMTVQDGDWGGSGTEIEGNVGVFDAEAFLAGASITAGSIGNIKITEGNFEGTLTLTDPVANGTNVFTVASDFTGVVVSNAPLKSIKVKGDFKGSLKAPTIGAITAFSFLGASPTMDGDLRGDADRHDIWATDGPLGLMRSTLGGVSSFEITAAGGFGGLLVKLSKLGVDTVGVDDVTVTAASIGKTTVGLVAAKTAPALNLAGIRDSQFTTTGTATSGILRGSIGAVSVILAGNADADGAGIRNSVFDARSNPVSSNNLLASLKVVVKGHDGNSVGIDADSAFLADNIGATTVLVSRGANLAATSRAVSGASFFSEGSIGAMKFDGDATMAQVDNLRVLAAGNVGGVSVKAKTAAVGSLTNSTILAGQTVDLSGATEADVIAALAKARMVGVKVSGDLSGSMIAAGGSVGAVNVGGNLSGSHLLAGARLGGDFLIDGDEAWQRAASIAGVTVKGSVQTSSIVAGVNPVNGVFGDGDDVVAAVAGVLDQASSIGVLHFSGTEYTPVGAALAAHQSAIQAAAIKSLVTATGTYTDFTTVQFLDAGAVGEDAADTLLRVIG